MNQEMIGLTREPYNACVSDKRVGHISMEHPQYQTGIGRRLSQNPSELSRPGRLVAANHFGIAVTLRRGSEAGMVADSNRVSQLG